MPRAPAAAATAAAAGAAIRLGQRPSPLCARTFSAWMIACSAGSASRSGAAISASQPVAAEEIARAAAAAGAGAAARARDACTSARASMAGGAGTTGMCA